MRKLTLPLAMLTLVVTISACKSGRKALEKGQYYQAVLQAVERLRKDPDNKNAKATLHDGYRLAKDYHEELARQARTSADPYKFETAFNQYRILNNLNDEIQRCPACRPLAKGARSYRNEMDDMSLKAAEARYAMGEQAMAMQNREKAKEAYNHYQVANSYQKNFRDVNVKIDEARWAATLKVVVEPIPMHSRAMELSNDFFQGQIDEYLANARISPFVAFMTPREIQQNQLNPDHIVELMFDDFVVGQHFVKETVEKVSRDSVKIGYTDKTREVPIYGTVTATLRHFHKEVVSSGLLNFRILDGRTQRVIVHDKFPGTHVWGCDWGSFNGDERALSAKQLRMVNGRELMPPPPQQLFVEFTKPIYDQLTTRINTFYRNY